MKTLFLTIGFFVFTLTAGAQTPECTQDSREKWMKSDEMKTKAENLGYKIRKFMTLEKCYEITGELDGKKVVHYFNPVTGVLVEKNAKPQTK